MSKNEVQLIRLSREHKRWKKQSIAGFTAKPIKNSNGTLNLEKWRCVIPGPKGTIWAEGSYVMYIDFPIDYPLKPPRCHFDPLLPHPNIYPSGTVCLSILNEEEDWKPSLTLRNILLGIQKLLKDEPNLKSPAQIEPTNMYKNNKSLYEKKAREFAQSQKHNK